MCIYISLYFMYMTAMFRGMICCSLKDLTKSTQE